MNTNAPSKNLLQPCVACAKPSAPGETFCRECLDTINAFAGDGNLNALKAHLLGVAIPSRPILDLCVERLIGGWEPKVGHFERLRAQVRLPGNPDWTKASISYFNLN